MISCSQYLFGSSLLPVVCKGFLYLLCHRPLWSPLRSSVKPVLATVCLFFDPLLIHTSFLSSPNPSHNMGMFNFSSCLGVHPLSPALFTGLLFSQPGGFPLSALPQPFPPRMLPPALHRGCLPSSQEETDWHTACIPRLKVKAHHLLCSSRRLQFSPLRCVSKQGALQLHSCSLITAKLNFQIQGIF